MVSYTRSLAKCRLNIFTSRLANHDIETLFLSTDLRPIVADNITFAFGNLCTSINVFCSFKHKTRSVRIKFQLRFMIVPLVTILIEGRYLRFLFFAKNLSGTQWKFEVNPLNNDPMISMAPPTLTPQLQNGYSCKKKIISILSWYAYRYIHVTLHVQDHWLLHFSHCLSLFPTQNHSVMVIRDIHFFLCAIRQLPLPIISSLTQKNDQICPQSFNEIHSSSWF